MPKSSSGEKPLTPAQEKVYARLKEVRESTTVSLKPIQLLRDKITDLTGTEVDFKLRYYQVQGVFHMVALRRMVLGDDTGLGKCQPFDSLILTDRGLLQIGEIEDWSEMAPESFRPLSRPLHVLMGGEAHPVKNYFYGGLKPTIKVTTRCGYQNTGTQVHPMLVLREGSHQWVEARHLMMGDFLCVERREAPFPESEPELPPGPKLTPELARFLGYYVGEGTLTCQYQVKVSQSPSVNPEVHADILRLFQECFGHSPRRPDQPDLYLNDVKLRRWLASIGLHYVRSPEREVPPCILQATRQSCREFLRGLFEGEAHAGKTHIEFSTASEVLGRQVQIMLLRFGIVSSRTPKHIKGRDTYWRLTICGQDAQQFEKTLGFISRRKIEALRACLDCSRNPNYDVIPGTPWIFEKVRDTLLDATTKHGSNNLRKGSGLKQFGPSFVNTLNNIRNYGRSPSYHFVSKTVEILREYAPSSEALVLLESFLETHYFYDPVVDLEDDEQEVFDIEVDHPSHSFVGNGMVNHNTIETIAALCALWEKEPANKVIVVAPKSAIPQWASEIRRFTTGVTPIIAGDDKQSGESPVDARKRSYQQWLDTDKSVLILNYAILVRDWNHEGFQPPKKGGKLENVVPGLFDKVTAQAGKEHLVTIYDEAHAFKGRRTKTWEVCRFLADRSYRCYGLTATLLKNRLDEGFSIYAVIKPGVFSTVTDFQDRYCHVKLQSVGRRKIPIIVGYKNLDKFRARIDPFYLGRKKHMVADELPALTTREITFQLNRAEDIKYSEALEGVLELGDGEIRDYEDNKALVSLLYCQQIVNSLAMLKFSEGQAIDGTEFDLDKTDWVDPKVGTLSSKEEALIDLLTGELDDQKVIIFTRFASLVPRLQALLKKNKIENVAITGRISSAAKRREAQEQFQDLKSKTRVILITEAGSQSINLQVANAMVFFDAPWSWGEYLQALGRMIRIGSPHQHVLAYHLLASRLNEDQTIDHHVLKLLRSKKKVIDQVLGEGAVGALEFDKSESSLNDLLRMMQGRGVGETP